MRDSNAQYTAVWSEETYDFDGDTNREIRDMNDQMDRDCGKEYFNYVDDN